MLFYIMDYYKILQVTPSASINEIKNSYKKLLLKSHKDNNSINNNNNQAKLLYEAYNQLLFKYTNSNFQNIDTIGNINKNTNIDISNRYEYIENYNKKEIENAKSNESNVNNLNNVNNINIERPYDIIINKNITLKEAYNGYLIPINIERNIETNSRKIIENETIYVNLPKGIDNNEVILLENKGNININNEKSDVKIFININETYNFSRNGIDLYYYKTITLKEALCGFSFTINFLNNENLIINNEKGNIIQPMTTKIIKNFGMKRENIVGNLIIIFNISYPSNISKNTAIKLEEIFNKEINS